VWNGRWWIHVRYCSAHCEALHELERSDAQAKSEADVKATKQRKTEYIEH
jgi:hypothetical protein